MRKYCMKCMRRITTGDVCTECGVVQPQRKLPHILPPGKILRERYLIGNSLGQGGFGITYIGCDLLLDMRVAIKEYFPSGYANRNVFSSAEVTVTNPQNGEFISSGLEKFLREARVLAEFHDADGIVDVRDFFRENNTAYIVMEYLDGITLQECIRDKLIAPELMVNLIMPVMDSLEKIHAKQVIHRDISPDNIMLMRSGKLKLMDFGAARQVDFSNQKSMSVVLKTGYAPVEQYRPKGELGPWTDIYALCATMYVCITGIHPDNALERVFSDTVKWPRSLGIPMTEALENVLKKGMAVAWRDRYQSIAELREALQQALKAPEAPTVVDGELTPPRPVENDRQALTEVISAVLQQRNDEIIPVSVASVTGGNNVEYSRTVAVIEEADDGKTMLDVPVPQPTPVPVMQPTAAPVIQPAAAPVVQPTMAPDIPPTAAIVMEPDPVGSAPAGGVPKKKKKSKPKAEDGQVPPRLRLNVEQPNPTGDAPVEGGGKPSAGGLAAIPAKVKLVAAAMLVLVILIVGVVVIASGDSGEEVVSQKETPAYFTMMADARNLLAEEGIEGTFDLTVKNENYNEKFKMYTAQCEAVVDGVSYNVDLKYSIEADEWVLNSTISGVTN